MPATTTNGDDTCPVCSLAAGGVETAVRRDLAQMPDAVKAVPALAASALLAGKILDTLVDDFGDLAPAPILAELRNTMTAIRSHQPVVPKVSASDRIAEQRAKRQRDASSAAR